MNIGKILPTEIVSAMQKSYLDYAMSVIVARALPDVRDGMKPVHRRVLYAMQQMGLLPPSRYTKAAKVVGEVLGKFHPHGDVPVYDSLVRLAQTFSMRYPLVDGQGNFGSIDGDPPAAMRYTECRLAAIAAEMLTDIDKNTVNFVDNFDATLKEPVYLPAKLPNLLLMGAEGIAVGMATKIPPHNLKEVIDAVTMMIETGKVAKDDAHISFVSETTLEDLMKHIKGPDFPTAGAIYDISEIMSAYGTGRGRIVMRGKAEIEEIGNGKSAIIITELPYQ
ncbi:MAG: DNA gyrase subunit A, partial [Patescibacteria group bacterium]